VLVVGGLVTVYGKYIPLSKLNSNIYRHRYARYGYSSGTTTILVGDADIIHMRNIHLARP
jgi:hypothetical protein